MATTGAVQPIPAQGLQTSPGARELKTLTSQGRSMSTSARRNEPRHKGAHSKKLKQTAKNKVSTGKYDMFVLRELARTEEAALKELVDMYKVESEDDLPVAFDVHEIVDMDVTERRSHLTTVLKDCPSDGKEAFIEKYVERINELNPHL